MALYLQSQLLGTADPNIDPWLEGLIEKILKLQLNPFQRVIVVEAADYHTLEDIGRAYLAEHLSHQLQKDVMWVMDGMNLGIDRYYVGPLETFLSGDRMLLSINGLAVLVHKPRTKESLDEIHGRSRGARVKIARPPNPFILYRKDHHKIVKAAHPELNNNQISQVLGNSWNIETQETRDRYRRMSAEIKKNLMQAHPDYRYSPRRPGERQRRARRAPPHTAASVVAAVERGLREAALGAPGVGKDAL
ncbi:hypothetical protein ACHAQA_007661 [Verticillium albo-atrum]